MRSTYILLQRALERVRLYDNMITIYRYRIACICLHDIHKYWKSKNRTTNNNYKKVKTNSYIVTYAGPVELSIRY